MSVEITIPSPGESISEVTVGTWMKQTGDWVDKDDILLEIESDKATLEITSPASGVLSATGETGAELAVGVVIGSIDTDAEKPAGGAAAPATEAEPATTAAPAETAAAHDDVKATPVAKKIAADELKSVFLSGTRRLECYGRRDEQGIRDEFESRLNWRPRDHGQGQC